MNVLKIDYSDDLSAKLLDELRDRVWDCCYSNLCWITRHNATLSRKIYSLSYAKTNSINHLKFNEVLAVYPKDRTDAHYMIASAVTLRPHLEKLLANYGAEFVNFPNEQDVLKKSKISAKAASEALPFEPTKPGEPSLPPKVAWVFHVDDWPTTKNVNQLYTIDPRTAKMPAWIHLKQTSVPRVISKLPETDLEVDYTPILNHVFGIAFDVLPAFPYLMQWGATIQTGVHSNAQLKDVRRVFEDDGVLVLDAKEGLKTQHSYSQFMDRIASNFSKNVYDSILEIWFDEAFLPREERSTLFKDLCIPKLSVKTIEDRLGILVEKIESKGADPTELYAELFLLQNNDWDLESPIWWNLAARLQSDKKLQKRLCERGFDEGALRIFERRFHIVARHRKVAPRLDVSVASLALPNNVDNDVATYLRNTFPLITDEFVIRLDDVFEFRGELHASIESLFQSPINDNPRRTFYKGNGPKTWIGPLLRSSERGDVNVLKRTVEHLHSLSTDQILQTEEGEFILRPLKPASKAESNFLASQFPMEGWGGFGGKMTVNASIKTDGEVAYIAVHSSTENFSSHDPEFIEARRTIELGSFEILRTLSVPNLNLLIQERISRFVDYDSRSWIHRAKGRKVSGEQLRILIELGYASSRWVTENNQVGRIENFTIVDEFGRELNWEKETLEQWAFLSDKPGYSQGAADAISVNPIYTGGSPQTPSVTQINIIRSRGWVEATPNIFVVPFETLGLVARLSYDDDHGIFTASFHQFDQTEVGGDPLKLSEVPLRLYAEVVQILVDAHPDDSYNPDLLAHPQYGFDEIQ